MSGVRTLSKFIKSANCNLVSTKFPKANTEIIFYHNTKNDLFIANEYNMRTICTKGSFKVLIGDDSFERKVTEVGPLENYRSDGFAKFISLEDDSEYYCIVANKGIIPKWNKQTLQINETANMEIGTINFLFGENYSINSNTYSAVNVFAIENNESIVTALGETTLVQFKIIE